MTLFSANRALGVAAAHQALGSIELLGVKSPRSSGIDNSSERALVDVLMVRVELPRPCPLHVDDAGVGRD
jgi:hypothetical protein